MYIVSKAAALVVALLQFLRGKQEVDLAGFRCRDQFSGQPQSTSQLLRQQVPSADQPKTEAIAPAVQRPDFRRRHALCKDKNTQDVILSVSEEASLVDGTAVFSATRIRSRRLR